MGPASDITPSLPGRAAYDELCELVGTEAALDGLRRLKEQIESISRATCDPAEELGRCAHAIVSQAALLGFAELSSSCKTLEEACKRRGDVASPLAQVKHCAAAALQQIDLLALTKD